MSVTGAKAEWFSRRHAGARNGEDEPGCGPGTDCGACFLDLYPLPRRAPSDLSCCRETRLPLNTGQLAAPSGNCGRETPAGKRRARER